MTVEEIRAAGAELAKLTRKAQGLPPKLADPAVLRRLAALFGPAESRSSVEPVRKRKSA